MGKANPSWLHGQLLGSLEMAAKNLLRAEKINKSESADPHIAAALSSIYAAKEALRAKPE